jgi:nucleoside-diphosphate-sugar epimerase
MKKILITGGTGFIGFHLLRYLEQFGNNITIIDDLSRGRRDKEFEDAIKQSNIRFIDADMTKKYFFKELGDYYDEIYHLAAVNGTKNFYNNPERVLEVNILSLMNMLDWINAVNCGKFLFTSSSEAYAGTITEYGGEYDYIPTKETIPLTINDVFNPRFSYGGSKLIGEILTINFLRAKNVPYSIVRYHNVYGPRMGFDHVIPEFCKKIFDRANPFPIFGMEETRAFCYVSDGVKATVAVMECEKTNQQIVHIGNGSEEIKILDMAFLLFKCADYKAKIEIKESPAGSVKRRCPDISKLTSLTGFIPEVKLEQGLKITYNWYVNKFKEIQS